MFWPNPIQKFDGGYYTRGETQEDFVVKEMITNDTIYRELVFIDQDNRRLQFVGLAYMMIETPGN